QGAALYGADAISGVTNIVSRFEGADQGERAHFGAGFGAAGSDFAANPAFQQSYNFALRAGTSLRSAGLTLDASSLGAYFPDVYSRQLSGTAAARKVGAKSILTGTIRF